MNRNSGWYLGFTTFLESGLPLGKTQLVRHNGLRLYNLDSDIRELSDVAGQHPDVVDRLQKLIEQMDADLGARGTGPGV